MNTPTFKYRYTPETLQRLELSFNVERLEVKHPFILVWVIPCTLQFIESGQLNKQYVKRFLLNG